MSWQVAQNAEVVISFIQLSVQPLALVVGTYLGVKNGPEYIKSKTSGAQEEILSRMLSRWESILHGLSPEQKAQLERQDPGNLARSLRRIANLQGQIRVLAAHSETASWISHLNPRSEIRTFWKVLADEVKDEDANLKRTTASVGADVVDFVIQVDRTSTEFAQAANITLQDSDVELRDVGQSPNRNPSETSLAPDDTSNLSDTPLDIEAIGTSVATTRPTAVPSRRDFADVLDATLVMTAAFISSWMRRHPANRAMATAIDMV
ncbi:hypothetical protein C8Q79DRAFT_150813 [Trametes meyenii]|nr:hypothetical protein C8Q79DRAFT_150813 [Trametes meyenii]